MKIKQTKKENLKHEYSVTLTAEEVGQKINDKLEEIGKTVKMPGFRPGKVPLKVLKSKYGKAVMGEVLESAVDESALKAINENELRPAMQPRIEVKTFDEEKGLEYIMEVELLPEFDVMDFSKIKLEKLTAAPEEKAVKDALDRIASSNKETALVEKARASKKGDILVIDFDGTVNGEPFPGMKGEGFPLELGSKSFIDTFEDQLVGSKVGDHKTVKVTFPEDYGQEELKGVDAVFEVNVKELREPVKATLDDEFAKKMGFDNVSKIEDAVKQQMQSEYDQVSRLNIKRQLLDAIDQEHDMEVPAGMVDAEFYAIWQQLKGKQHPDDPSHQHGAECNHDSDDDKGTKAENDEYRSIAKRRVKLGLVLAEAGRINKVEVTNQEIQQAVMAEARKYPGQEAQVFEFYQKNPQAIEGIKAPIYEDKVVDFVLETANIEERQVSIEELTKTAEQEEAADASSSSKGKKTSKKSAAKK